MCIRDSLKTYVSAAMVYGQDPTSALRAMFLQRGLLTWWGHPLFTTCTAIGVAFAMRNRSKWVRVVAPLAGYLCAATLHMLFNGSSLFFGDDAGAATVSYTHLDVYKRQVSEARSPARSPW